MLLQLCVCLSSASLLLHTASGAGRGAGRAFPIDAENYVMDSFSRINPNIEWDYTNFLVDLAGTYANCDATKGSGSAFDTNTLTPGGETVSGVVDWTDGSGADVDSVNEYIRTVIDRWTTERRYNSLIEGANTFGCSIRPGCRGAAVVSCLFSPGGTGSQGSETEGEGEPEKITSVNAVAFTPEQYSLVEQYTGNKWDRSHFLENLSGRETSCAMIDTDNWPFVQLRQAEIEYGMRVSAVYGNAQNLGSTQEAIERILPTFKQVKTADKLGCSLIPDCIADGRMYVVVSCLFEE